MVKSLKTRINFFLWLEQLGSLTRWGRQGSSKNTQPKRTGVRRTVNDRCIFKNRFWTLISWRTSVSLSPHSPLTLLSSAATSEMTFLRIFFFLNQCEASKLSSRPNSKSRWCVCGDARAATNASELFPAIIAAQQTLQTLLFCISRLFPEYWIFSPKGACWFMSLHNYSRYWDGSDCIHETFKKRLFYVQNDKVLNSVSFSFHF